eukprot:105745-Pyramimonas_sp.AAC.1
MGSSSDTIQRLTRLSMFMVEMITLLVMFVICGARSTLARSLLQLRARVETMREADCETDHCPRADASDWTRKRERGKHSCDQLRCR